MRVDIELSSKALVGEAVKECFATDPDLISKYHVAAPAPVYECVSKTLEDVKGFDPSFKFYRAYVNHRLAAYWGTEKDSYINLIFVKPFYRRTKFMDVFWEAIKDSMAGPFSTAIYEKNLPAIQFYSKHGQKGQSIEVDGHPVVIFHFEKD